MVCSALFLVVGGLVQGSRLCVKEEGCCSRGREEKPARCHWMFYCTYNMFNIFRALLCPSSGAQDYICVITVYGVQYLFAGCRRSGAGQQAVSQRRGMLQSCTTLHWCSKPVGGPVKLLCKAIPKFPKRGPEYCLVSEERVQVIKNYNKRF